MSKSEMIISPRKEKGEPELPLSGLLMINPAEADAGMRLAKNRKGRQYFLFNSKLMVISSVQPAGTCFIAGPAVGAPMAVLTLEKLVALGARRIIIYGWCGSLHASLRIGDVLLPTWAISDEGTSSHYPVKLRSESHAATRKLLTEKLTAQGLNVLSGPIWTTDAPYRESKKRVEQLGGQGVLGVDMEFAGMAAAATFRKVEITSVLLVSDELFTGTWKPGFRTKTFKEKSRQLLYFLMDFCPSLQTS